MIPQLIPLLPYFYRETSLYVSLLRLGHRHGAKNENQHLLSSNLPSLPMRSLRFRCITHGLDYIIERFAAEFCVTSYEKSSQSTQVYFLKLLLCAQKCSISVNLVLDILFDFLSRRNSAVELSMI